MKWVYGVDMSGAPWLTPNGQYLCFLCDTPKTRTGRQKDPDSAHKGLRDSHQVLWSRPLPNRDAWVFAPTRGWYLKSINPTPEEPAEWSVGSDNFATTHTNALPAMASRIPGYDNGHICDFCTIGGYIVFPNGLAQRRETLAPARKWTLNQAKGCDRGIADRFDLTLEAIRLYYARVRDRARNPLGDVLDAYGWFFDAFGQGAEGFNAYVGYFFLDPMVERGRVRPWYGREVEFGDALPRTSESAYLSYIAAQRDFVSSRNDLIQGWWQGGLPRVWLTPDL